MLDQTIDCIVTEAEGLRPVHVVRPQGLAGLLDRLPPLRPVSCAILHSVRRRVNFASCPAQTA